MKTFILVLSSLFVFINPNFEMKTKEKPRILESSRFRTVDCTPDVISECVYERLVIINPMLYAVTVTLNCGDSSEEADVNISPRVKLTVDVSLDLPGDPQIPSCHIKSWKKKL